MDRETTITSLSTKISHLVNPQFSWCYSLALGIEGGLNNDMDT